MSAPSLKFDKEDDSSRKIGIDDVVLALGILGAILTLALIFLFAHGDMKATLAVLWGWVVEIALWVYVFVASI